LVVAGAAKELKDGVEIARKSLSGGGARARLEKLIEVSRG
jgi:anthranilate phosphoribosyltransferase